jgi:hypothetical protein
MPENCVYVCMCVRVYVCRVFLMYGLWGVLKNLMICSQRRCALLGIDIDFTIWGQACSYLGHAHLYLQF